MSLVEGLSSSRELLSPSTGDIHDFTLSERSKDKIVKGRCN